MGCFQGVVLTLGFCFLYPPFNTLSYFDPLIMRCFEGVFYSVVFVSYILGRKRTREEEEEEKEDSKEGTPSPKDPKPSLKGSTLESPLLPLNPKPSFKAQGLGCIC